MCQIQAKDDLLAKRPNRSSADIKEEKKEQDRKKKQERKEAIITTIIVGTAAALLAGYHFTNVNETGRAFCEENLPWLVFGSHNNVKDKSKKQSTKSDFQKNEELIQQIKITIKENKRALAQDDKSWEETKRYLAESEAKTQAFAEKVIKENKEYNEKIVAVMESAEWKKCEAIFSEEQTKIIVDRIGDKSPNNTEKCDEKLSELTANLNKKFDEMLAELDQKN